MRALFSSTVVVLLMLSGVACKKDAPTCRGMTRCCSLLKSAGKGKEAQSFYCDNLDDAKESTCQIQMPGLIQKIKDPQARSMCSKAIKEEVFKEKK